ncbi:MAG: DegT/DnrJ/EryC1/StrS family aminotransferase [Acidobacteria bacterium]|nr:DegT/DnrJ/EryC1/StrS family aminotransferase [Acidobacteriota bacterium]
MRVPFVDAVASNMEDLEEMVELFRSIVISGQFVGGAEVESFEKEFAGFCGTSESVAVSTGTDALRFALMAAGIGNNDLVLTAPNTFIATTEAITQAGAAFDFVDIDEKTYTIDPEALSEYFKRSSRPVKAIIPVHLYGQMADMDPILTLAAENGAIVIEDACQAHGAEYYSIKRKRWFRAGSMGLAAAFSFYPGKNLGACGEGGAVTTDDPDLAARIRMLRDHGQSAKYRHEVEGYNGRLDAIQCGILRLKLRHLEKWNERRRSAASVYGTMLEGIEGISLPHVPERVKSVFHLYVIRAEMRDELQNWLAARGVGTGLHYPVPLHMQKCYAGRKWSPEDYPVAAEAAGSILSLPMYPQLSTIQQRYVADQILAFRSEIGVRARFG